jgi:GNAT superfamily N-acetyltransferase
MKLRPAVAADADGLAALFTASRNLLSFLPALHSAEEDSGYIAGVVLPTMRVTVAEGDDGGLLGFIAEEEGWVVHLYLAPESRRMGIGTALLELAKSHQPQLDLWCFADNAPARAFYERHGFVAVEHTDGAGNEAKMPDIRYRWIRPRAG